MQLFALRIKAKFDMIYVYQMPISVLVHMQ